MCKASFHADENGIKMIIAKYWNVPPENVTLTVIQRDNAEPSIECHVDISENHDYDNIEATAGEITKQMISDGIDKNIIQFIIDPNMGAGTVCSIGEYWFYFGGLTAEELNPAQYIADVPKEDIVNGIYDVLKDFKNDPDSETEFAYYYAFLKENL